MRSTAMFFLHVLLAVRLVVYVLAPPAAEATLEGARAGLGTALANDTALEFVVVKELPKEAAPASEAAIATVSWSDDGRRVLIRVRKHDDAAALERELSFDPRDSLRERGRTTGFAIASMLSEERDPSSEPAPTGPTPKPAPPATAATPPSNVPRTEPPAATPPTPPRFSLEAALSGGVGFGGVADGLGGGVGARLRLTGPLWLSLGLRLRRSEITEVKATSTFTQGALGAYLGGPIDAHRRLTLGARADIGLEWQYLSHFSGDEPAAVGEGRVVPIFGAAAEGGVHVSDSVELWVGLGPQIAAGTTDLYLKSTLATRIPLLRGVLDVGFRAYF